MQVGNIPVAFVMEADTQRPAAVDGRFLSVPGIQELQLQEADLPCALALANGSEVKKPLLETSRRGYLGAVSASAYSMVSLVRHLGPIMPRGGAAL